MPYYDAHPVWVKTDEYLDSLFSGHDNVTEAVLKNNSAAGLPPIDVSRSQGQFLGLLAQMSGAKRVLEIGTLGAFSTIHFARSIPADGKVTTLEINPKHAKVAQANIDSAGLGDKVDILVGTALDLLPSLSGPYDLVFIDADKANMPNYLKWALKLSKPGTVIIGDNVIRRGQISDPNNTDENVIGAKEFLRLVAEEPSLTASTLQTVGSKGHDGFLVARVSS